MKRTLLTGIVGVGAFCGCAFAGNYLLSIDGQEFEIELGEETALSLPDGNRVQIKLNKKAIVRFRSDTFAFDHPNEFTPSRTNLGDGIHQTMMSSPVGTLVMVQEYANMDPSTLVDLMLNELTKEEKNYGYEIAISPATKKLADGTTLSGKKATSTYRGEQRTLHVLHHAVKDAGILFITGIDGDATAEDQAMMATFWKSLALSLS